MPKPDIDYSLYYVTARDPACGIDSFVDHLEGACRGGVTVVQLREKTASTRDFLNVAKAAKAVTDRFRIPLFINDRLDIALAVGCHLHVGQDDFPALQARALLGPDALIGVSVNTPDELEEVLREGTADYVGIGPIHATLSKKDHNPPIGNRGARDLLALLEDSPVKAVAIGGLNADTLPAFLAQSPAYVRKSQSYRTYDGVACVSAISAASDPQAAAMQLRQAFRSEGPRYPLPSPACARSAEEMVRAAAALLRELRSSDPKVCQNITNQVVMNDTANLTLALSSSPIMSGNPEEAVELGGLIGALVLNMGTVDARQVQGATLAGKTANRNAKPVLLDPVGVGASTFRKETIAQLMDDVHMTVIKGNAGEIGALAGLSEVQSRGVDSAGPGFKDPGTVVCDLARREKTVVAMSGETDWVSDGQVVFSISNGHRYQGDITGSGCMLSAAIACFLSVSGRDRALEATVAAILAYNIAAEVAGTRDDVRGPNTFRSALIDECYNLKPEQIEKAARLVLM